MLAFSLPTLQPFRMRAGQKAVYRIKTQLTFTLEC